MQTTSVLEQIHARLERAEAHDELQACIEDARDCFGVQHIIYHWVSGDGDQYGCGTYPLDWVDRYVEKNYVRIDPVILGCFQKFHPIDWKTLDWSGKATRAFLQDAIDHGIGNQGYSIPIRGPNGQFAHFTLSRSASDDEWSAFIAQYKRDLILLAHAFNEKALEIQPGRAPAAAQPLSPRELDVMTLLAAGHSRSQAAAHLSISEHTLRVYVESARHKLGAMNTTHAVARALSRGLIVV